ncbi:MAG TPA: hypothetical protein VHD33_08040, partial [Legionellaceae bacterium]|nr:hypothetical protein [Legionellaceae bacterium]
MKPLASIASVSPNHHTLNELIVAYNQLLDQRTANAEIEKLFLLQKISHILETSFYDIKLMDWYDQFGEESFEAHLQHYGIQRDAATLVKNIQFATAVTHLSPSTNAQHLDYFDALRERNQLFTNSHLPTANDLAAYVLHNQTISEHYANSPELLEKVLRSRHFLALCYAKMEAIKGAVEQSFGNYQVNTLGDGLGNNKNFILQIAGEEKQLVIRVESRRSLATEEQLQTYPVSEYFSEDYYTIMMPFAIENEIEYRPVVLTEYVEKGALNDHAISLSKTASSNEIIAETQRIFTMLNDFCLKLMDSGHYHPDIKLSNFLTDGQSIKVADRKTILNKIQPQAIDVLSTPNYAPPEYLKCLNPSGTAISPFKGRSVNLDMPQFMSYQVGMALKEFLLTGLQASDLTVEVFMQWNAIEHFISSPTTAQRNLFILVQELTRYHPSDRLSIQNFQVLLAKIHLPTNTFMQELEHLSPSAQLTYHKEMAVLNAIKHCKELTPELEQAWTGLEMDGIANHLYEDPRMNFITDIKNELKHYFEKIDKLIKAADLKKASRIQQLGAYLGIKVPNTTTITDLPAVPIIDKKMQR